MSTKIYDGVRIRHAGIMDIMGKLDEFAREATALSKKLAAKDEVSVAIDIIDAVAMNEKNPFASDGDIGDAGDKLWQDAHKYSPLTAASMYLSDRQNKANASMHRDAHDISCKVHIFPISRTIVLARPQWERREYTKLWKGMPWVEEYGYWNNTDKPDDVSNRLWRQRKSDWNKVFKYDGVDYRGLAKDIVSDWPFLMLDTFEDAIFDSVDTRAMRLGRSKVAYERWMDTGGSDAKLSSYVRADKWTRETEEGQKKVADAAAEIKVKLSEITIDLLRTKINQDKKES